MNSTCVVCRRPVSPGRRYRTCGRASCADAVRRQNGLNSRVSWHRRFAEKVTVRDGRCWEWVGSVGSDGYGQIGISGLNRRAHRMSYIIHNGAIPEGMFVCHTCDNRRCVNPDHLYAGTHGDNMKDRAARGRTRAPVGVRNGHAKLTPGKVRSLRKMVASGVPQHQIAAHFGVHQSSVSKVIHGVVWSHVR